MGLLARACAAARQWSAATGWGELTTVVIAWGLPGEFGLILQTLVLKSGNHHDRPFGFEQDST